MANEAGYADVGVVVDLGPAADFTSTTSYGYVTSVNRHRADAILGLEAHGGHVTAYALPFSRGFGS